MTLKYTVDRRRLGLLALALLTAACVAPRVRSPSQLAAKRHVRVEGLPLVIRGADAPTVACSVSVVDGMLESVAGDTLTFYTAQRWAYQGQPMCSSSERIMVVLSESVSPRVLNWERSRSRTFGAVVLWVAAALTVGYIFVMWDSD